VSNDFSEWGRALAVAEPLRRSDDNRQTSGSTWARRYEVFVRMKPFTLILVVATLCSSVAPVRADAPPAPSMRAERMRLASGAELVTIFGASERTPDVPLVAYLNDTLGDEDPTNDRLRYLWVFSYCPPSAWRRVLASVPFYYGRFAASGRPDPDRAPPVVFDFSRGSDSAWRRIMWLAVQSALLDPRGWLLHAGGRTYARNEREYRQVHLERGLAVLSLYREGGDEVAELDDPSFERYYGQIVESGVAGLFLDDRHLADVYVRDSKASRKRTGKNWEMLRQRSEEEGLYFEPLPGPPARARHAVVWVAAEAIAASPKRRPFNARFLNISSPWADDDLRAWNGYTRTFYEAPDGRLGPEQAPGSRPVTMIPLAVYGLDFPKIPALLVDFRSVLNATRREVSRRVVDDVGRYVVDASPFGDVYLYAVKKLYAMITGRQGIDLNQPSRLKSYAQLRSLLLLKDVFEPELRAVVERDLARLELNPLATSLGDEASLAAIQHRALIMHADRGDLDRRVEDDRAAEMTRLAHGRVATALLGVARVVTLGLYRHRDDSPELRARYRDARSLERHGRLLAEVAAAPAPVEVTWSPERFHPALEYVAVHGEHAGRKLARACEEIFHKSGDPATRILVLQALDRVEDDAARDALARIAADPSLDATWRDGAARLLASGRGASKGASGGGGPAAGGLAP
jgi:hypothetical protein